MGYAFAVPVLFLLALAETTVLAQFRILDLSPDLLVIAVALIGVVVHWRAGLIWAVIGGVCLSLVSPGALPMGTYVLGLTWVALLAALALVSGFNQRFLLVLLAAFVGTWLYDATQLLLLWLSGVRINWLNVVSLIVMPTAVINALLAALLLWPVDWLFDRFQRAGLRSRPL